jgi:hypothetical protein
MWSAFNKGVRRRSFAIKMFAYLIARSYLTIHKQQLVINELEEELKNLKRLRG